MRSKLMRVLAIILLVVAIACFVCAILSAVGLTWGTSLTAGTIAASAGPGILGLAWGWWLIFGVIALIAGYACDPEYVRTAVRNLVSGAGKLITTIADELGSAVTSSSLFWLIIAGVGVWLLLKSGGSDDGRARIEVVQPDGSPQGLTESGNNRNNERAH